MPPKDPNPAISLLSRAHSPETTTRIFTEKIKLRPLHLKPTTSTPPTAQTTRRLARERKLSSRLKKLKPRPLSAKQKRALCLYDIPSSQLKYEIYAPLHEMWVNYIVEVLGGEKCMPVTGAAAAKLCGADFHGAEVEVVRSRCVGRVGVRGIVVRDSRGVFEIITKGKGKGKDRVVMVPKEGTVFRFSVPMPVGGEKEINEENEGDKERNEREKGSNIKELVFELHGDQFMTRASDRANKNPKWHFLKDV